MSVCQAIRNRKLGLSSRIEIDFAYDRIKLKESVKLTTLQGDEINDEERKSYGPLACTKLRNGLIAVANEDGYVNLLQTNTLKNVAHWLGHENAIFDIKSDPDQKSLFTASGDTTIRKWDLETKQSVSTIAPHYSSIKSISLYDSNTIASGSRDGTIKVHDLRLKSPTIMMIRDAHRNHNCSKRRRVVAKTDPVSCVTNVAFDQNFPRLYSTGANDATIKLWDLRRYNMLNKPRRTIEGQLLLSQPNKIVQHPISGKHCGYSHLLLSSGKVYAACSDQRIYCYENFGCDSKPVEFTGYRYDTYLRLAVMDDRFLISGAKGGGAIVWSLRNKSSPTYDPQVPRTPVGQLKPDDNDASDTNVIETDWDSLSIFTFRDDRFVCKWSLQNAAGK